MIVTDPSPPFDRLVAAALVAPLGPTLVAALGGPFAGGREAMVLGVVDRLYSGYLLTLFTVVVLGLPALAVLRRRVRLTTLHYTLIGVAVATLPVMVFGTLVSLPARDMVDLLGRLGALGALGGVTFWAVAAARPVPRSSGGA